MKKCEFLKLVYPIITILLVGSFAGCATPGKDTAIGGGGGAAAGAGLGAVLGGGKGALIGAGAGALVGSAVGNYLDKQSHQLAQVAQTKRTEDGILVNLKNDLLFTTGSSDLKPDAQTQLSQLGQILVKYPQDRIKVEGYTDNSGSTQFNQMLSQQRAQAVATALEQQGVKVQQLEIQGMGPAHPVANNKTSTGRSKNRRVELKIDVPS